MRERCLKLGDQSVAPEPHPTFTGGQSWTCRRCGETFSEETPTFYPSGECQKALQEENARALAELNAEEG